MEVPDYELPEAAIAQSPLEPRHAARLLDALDPCGLVAHRTVWDLPDLLGPGDVVVVNDTRVIPARLGLEKSSGGAAEVLLLEDCGGNQWVGLVRPGRRLQPGTRLGPPGWARSAWAESDRDGAVVEVGERLDDGQRQIRFLAEPADVMERYGEVALPPYIHEDLADPDRYQTVYASRPGSIAAPTAGLHLTRPVLDRIRERGALVHPVDLAVGLGTFRPIKSERAEEHVMHQEHYRVPAATWDACRAATRVVAVGTTTVRALESAALTGRLEGTTDLYIHPGFPFSVVDVLLTNFHLPRSTLLLMLEAFAGPGWRDIYAEALRSGYRFLSFGDAMIVGRAAR